MNQLQTTYNGAKNEKYCLYLKIAKMVYIWNFVAKNRMDIQLIAYYLMNTWFLLF